MLSNKFAQYLVKNNIFDLELIEKAEKKMEEYGGTSASALARVLEIEFGASHDAVYEALSIHLRFSHLQKNLRRDSRKPD